MHQKLLENVQGVFLRQVFRVRFVCLNAGSGRITCSGYPGRRPPSPPPSSCSSPWPPTGRLKHTKHAKLKSNLIAKSFLQKDKKKRKTNLRSICKMKRGRNEDIYLKGTCYVIYLFHYFDSFSVRACGRKLRLVFTKKLGLIKKNGSTKMSPYLRACQPPSAAWSPTSRRTQHEPQPGGEQRHKLSLTKLPQRN